MILWENLLMEEMLMQDIGKWKNNSSYWLFYVSACTMHQRSYFNQIQNYLLIEGIVKIVV